jgi:hypothetical protein
MVVSFIWAVSGPMPLLVLTLASLVQIMWLEWSATNENRPQVKKVNLVLGTAIAALAAHGAYEEHKINEAQRERLAMDRQAAAIGRSTAPYDAQGKWVGYNPLDYGDR